MNVNLTEESRQSLDDIINSGNKKTEIINYFVKKGKNRKSSRRFINRFLENEESKKQKAIQYSKFELLAEAIYSLSGRVAAEKLANSINITLPEPDPEESPLRKSTAEQLRIICDVFDSNEVFNQYSNEAIKNLPDELVLAINSFHGLWQTSEISKQSFTSMDPTLIQLTKFTGCDDLEKPQQEFEKAISKIHQRTNPAEFDDLVAAADPVSSISNQILFLYPFTLSSFLRPTFGIIPFAKQKKLGVVLHKEHPAFEKIEGPFNRHSWKNYKHGQIESIIPDDPNATSEWLSEIISETQKDGKISSISGDVQISILLSIMRKSPSFQNFLSKFGSVQKRTMWPTDNTGKRAKGLNPGALIGTKDILIFDIWEAKQFTQNDNYRFLILDHDIPVPVGVGFSINMLLLLLKDELWKKIQKAAKDAYEPYKNDLEKIGIEMI